MSVRFEVTTVDHVSSLTNSVGLIGGKMGNQEMLTNRMDLCQESRHLRDGFVRKFLRKTSRGK
ncbi:hypothetical protein, partial [Paenibacillus xylanexedens]|uniref:hypothetical protein n=1 Tax=Paenibacillus xylanexedens TaxID=528191 RepID=UPI001C930218